MALCDSKINIHKVNGVKIAVPIEKLSAEDLEYVESLTGQKITPFSVKLARNIHILVNGHIHHLRRDIIRQSSTIQPQQPPPSTKATKAKAKAPTTELQLNTLDPPVNAGTDALVVELAPPAKASQLVKFSPPKNFPTVCASVK
jgi:hypothetical protein